MVRFIHTDQLGSPRVRTDESGSVISVAQFFPFGLLMPPVGELRPAVGFTGHEPDDETDLIYMKARYYQAENGRFLSVDPVENPHRELPHLWNRYIYSRNSPLSFVDREGFCESPALTDSQVGICVEAYIAAPFLEMPAGIGLIAVGFGDNRVRSPYSGTYRAQVHIIFDTETGEIRVRDLPASTSETTWFGVYDINLKATSGTTSSIKTDGEVTTVSTQTLAMSGFGSAAQEGPIELNGEWIFREGVGLTVATGSTKAYPTYDGWYYQPGKEPVHLFHVDETEISALGGEDTEFWVAIGDLAEAGCDACFWLMWLSFGQQ